MATSLWRDRPVPSICPRRDRYKRTIREASPDGSRGWASPRHRRRLLPWFRFLLLPAPATTVTYTAQYSHPAGASALTTVSLLVSTSASTDIACYVTYTASTGKFILYNDFAATGSTTVPTGGIAQNSQCILNGGGSSVSLAGTTLTLTLSLTFQPGFVGQQDDLSGSHRRNHQHRFRPGRLMEHHTSPSAAFRRRREPQRRPGAGAVVHLCVLRFTESAESSGHRISVFRGRLRSQFLRRDLQSGSWDHLPAGGQRSEPDVEVVGVGALFCKTANARLARRVSPS